MSNNSQYSHDDLTSQFHAALADSVSLALSHDERLRSISPTSTIATSADHPACGFDLQDDLNLNDNNSSGDDNDDEPKSWIERIRHLYEKESLLIEVTLAILFAKIYPRLGAVYLFPEITAHWIAVVIIFFLSGFSLRLKQVFSAVSNWKFNFFVIFFNFIFVSFVVNIVANFFLINEIVSEDLMKGMIICSCLSMPTNMMVVLTVGSNGNEAVALFLATLMNLMGVFVTPLLIFCYLQEEAEIDFIRTYTTISLRVLLPITIGIMLRKKVEGADVFAVDNKKVFHKIRERCLVYVVYATFCSTFLSRSDSTRSQILVMALSQIILLGAAMSLAWLFLFIFFNREPELRVVGLYGCSTKTAALGIPLISAIYEDHPKLGIYTLPLLIWYPSQLIIGTMLGPRMTKFVNYKRRKYELELQSRPKMCGLIQA
uniref:Sodium/bile acid cotransporter n=1 Tax=Chaetoceros debilis TaxID=122233 RepID=A0A7S3VCT1_9STRA|mmetsp:Transcript_27289/g.40328  ORF Transcript_27289/g.40328 Transcript_27289/m.40328 type:complete len:430 (+) Transcript_27289:266-1555(+)|eukprot:CAMPEP_0194088758 /NCGR_PEP_ID=MMETSP0149-20130528/30869_1 /TAXON_ID=122233 /ORGANISM="Chaetoceros debilis, Strain MM31A-1" /LENGTH=429 /DNA_ID=CAMNT_0038772491 /DNA_START=196 /DNA_END=1485 /DNA_ORIENTATION=+